MTKHKVWGSRHRRLPRKIVKLELDSHAGRIAGADIIAVDVENRIPQPLLFAIIGAGQVAAFQLELQFLARNRQP